MTYVSRCLPHCPQAIERGCQFVLLGSAPDPKVQAEFDELANELGHGQVRQWLPAVAGGRLGFEPNAIRLLCGTAHKTVLCLRPYALVRQIIAATKRFCLQLEQHTKHPSQQTAAFEDNTVFKPR